MGLSIIDDYSKQYNEWRDDVISKLDQKMIDCVLEMYEYDIEEGKMFLCDSKDDRLPIRYTMYRVGFYPDSCYTEFIKEFEKNAFNNQTPERNWRKFCRVKNECENIAKELGIHWENPVADSVVIVGRPIYSSVKNKYEYEIKKDNKYIFNKFEYKKPLENPLKKVRTMKIENENVVFKTNDKIKIEKE